MLKIMLNIFKKGKYDLERFFSAVINYCIISSCVIMLSTSRVFHAIFHLYFWFIISKIDLTSANLCYVLFSRDHLSSSRQTSR